MHNSIKKLVDCCNRMLAAIEEMDNANNEGMFYNAEKKLLGCIPQFKELGSKVNGEMNVYEFNAKKINKEKMRRELEGHYFSYGDDCYIHITKVGRFESKNNETWLEDCTIYGIWFQLSRLEMVTSVGTKIHSSVRYASLKQISKEEFDNVFDKKFSKYLHNNQKSQKEETEQ